MIIAQDHRFRLCQSPCFDVVIVLKFSHNDRTMKSSIKTLGKCISI